MDTPVWMHACIPVGVDSGLRRNDDNSENDGSAESMP